MSKLSDEQLLKELQQRIEEKNLLLEEQKQFVSDLKMVNDKLLQSEKLKSQFLSNIKNEINNPMTSILGLLKHNLAKSDHQEMVVKNTQLIFREAATLNFQLQNIFMAAELEAGEAQLQVGSFSCKKMIEEALELVQSYTGETISCEITGDDGLQLKSDRHKALVMFSNLISNAHKFRGKDNPQIKIIISRHDEQASVVVSDNGVGISDADRANIYDRFNQLEIGTTKNYGGHGLGLSIVHSLVDLLDGNMKIDTTINEGTSVMVTIPVECDASETKLFEDEGFDLFFEDENEQTF